MAIRDRAPAEMRLRDVDVRFDATWGTPQGESRDPDADSPTLRAFHRLLWSKPLPDGTPFTPTAAARKPYLLHDSLLGQFELSSDFIFNSHHS